jgi:hypothetical protein
MVRILGTCAALALLILMAFPFAKEAYHRYAVAKRLDPLMDDRDRAAFRAWSGDAASFGRSLYERCELVNGRDAPACDPFKSALR